jgi:hypothetical protein
MFSSARLVAIFTLLSLSFSVAAPSLAFDPEYIISDREFQDSEALTLGEIQRLLERGFLGQAVLEDWQGVRRTAAEIVFRAARDHQVSPAVLLVMLQKEQSLVDDDDPTQKQLDWAMGYAVCDDCSMSDPKISRWRGFGKQVNSAAMQLTDGYLSDIATYGTTAGKYGPGVTVTISGEEITPQNAATAALYAYTPHLHGNQLFASLYEAWFGREYPDGTLVQVPGEDGVWLLRYGQRRAITSRSALLSRYNPDLIVPITETVLARYEIGPSISLPNYSLALAPNGDIYLIVDDSKRHIADMETFRTLGFNEEELIEVSTADLASYTDGLPLSNTSLYPQGRLFQLTTNGAVFYVEDGVRRPILDRSIMTARFGLNPRLTPIAPVNIEQFREGKPLNLPDGSLIKGTDSPAVYVLSEGERRLIPTESVFNGFGYTWTNILTVPASVLNLHPLGQPLEDAGS